MLFKGTKSLSSYSDLIKPIEMSSLQHGEQLKGGDESMSVDDVIDLLAAHFHVIAPDLPGFGDSAKPSPSRYEYGFSAFAESMADLIAGLGVGRVHVAGHS